jgi:hypothetical protein
MRSPAELPINLFKAHGWAAAIARAIAKLGDIGLFLDHHVLYAGPCRQGLREGHLFQVRYSGTFFDHCTDTQLLNPRPVDSAALLALSREKLVSKGDRDNDVALMIALMEHHATRNYWVGQCPLSGSMDVRRRRRSSDHEIRDL